MLTYLTAAAVAAAAPASDARDIVVTATRRPTPANEIPVAITAVGAEQIERAGVRDIRDLNILVPSLLVSSSSNEAGGAGARIRGVGTVGDNPGLESSVVTFVDGVYRSRAAVALTELGAVERIEVLRGPQGTLFGRNASAGLISVTTPAPSFDLGGYAEAGFGNYGSRRLAGGVTGPLSPTLAFRVDAVETKRDGLVRDVTSGRRVYGRDRWLARGKLLFRPDNTLTATLIADYQRRDEECCAGVYLPTRDLRSSTPGAGGGQIVTAPSSIAALIRANGGIVIEDPARRQVALTPGRTFRQDVEDGGVSLDIEKDFGGVTFSSISAWRGNKFIKGQDGDFGSLDLLVRPSDGSGFIRFSNWSQELRLRGTAFADRLDWLVGGYAVQERLTLQDNLAYGQDYDRFASARIGALGGGFAAFPGFGFANLSGFARNYAASGGTAAANAIAAQVQNTQLNGTGELDRFRQRDRNIALFTHDIVHLSDRLSLTLGARYTRDSKRLDATLASTSTCNIYVANIQRLRALAAASGTPAATATLATALANNVLAPLGGYPCNINSLAGTISDRHRERRWSGTAALDYRIAPGLNAYASWSRGYKAGGFNLDRAALFNAGRLAALPVGSLQFAPETVNAIELGAKYHARSFDLSIALFRQNFRNFQLNSYTGTNFIVSNVRGCTGDLGTRDSDAVTANSACADTRSGVVSRGVELDAVLRPVDDVALAAGLAYADTRYRDDIVGSPDPLTGDNSLPPVLFRLPGARLSNAPAFVGTASVSWTPGLGRGLRGLLHADLRYQSRINTGSDLLVEKAQAGFAIVNARIGISRDEAWSLELWASNLFNKRTVQVAFSEPLQGGGSGGLPGTSAAVAAFGTTATQLFGAFLGEPRLWGATLGHRF